MSANDRIQADNPTYMLQALKQRRESLKYFEVATSFIVFFCLFLRGFKHIHTSTQHFFSHVAIRFKQAHEHLTHNGYRSSHKVQQLHSVQTGYAQIQRTHSVINDKSHTCILVYTLKHRNSQHTAMATTKQHTSGHTYRERTIKACCQGYVVGHAAVSAYSDIG